MQIHWIIAVLIVSLASCSAPAPTAPETPAPLFPKGTQGPAEFFTGVAHNYPLVGMDSIYNTVIGHVAFEPKARSNWHTHPSGQILIVTEGVGYHQIKGEPVEVIRKGDVVKCPPNVEHWHGASADSAMSHIYILPNTERGVVEWLSSVKDADYPTATN